MHLPKTFAMNKVSDVTIINGLYLILILGLMSQQRRDLSSNFVELERCSVGNYLAVDRSCWDFLEEIRLSTRTEPKYKEWRLKAVDIDSKVNGFIGVIDSTMTSVLAAAGGPDSSFSGRPTLFRSRSVTSRMYSEDGGVERLVEKILVLYSELMKVIDKSDRQSMHLSLEKYLRTDRPLWQFSLQHNLPHLPVAAVLALLSQLKLDAKISELAVLNYCMDKTIGGCGGGLDKYLVAIVPKKQYLLSGLDNFAASVVLGRYAALSPKVVLFGNGMLLPNNEGLGLFSGPIEHGIGERIFTASARIRHPLTGRVEWVKSVIKYQVGGSSVDVLADKMQVFYVGIDHHLAIKATDFSSADLQVTVQGADASIRQEGSDYVLTARDTGVCKVLVKTPDYKFPMEFSYQVKPCPDPIPVLGAIGKRNFDAGEFQQVDSLSAQLPDFDFAQDCTIVGFHLTKVGKRVDPIEVPNNSGRFSAEAKALIQSAAAGDHYLFTDIQARCAGDKSSRAIGSLCVVIR